MSAYNTCNKASLCLIHHWHKLFHLLTMIHVKYSDHNFFSFAETTAAKFHVIPTVLMHKKGDMLCKAHHWNFANLNNREDLASLKLLMTQNSVVNAWIALKKTKAVKTTKLSLTVTDISGSSSFSTSTCDKSGSEAIHDLQWTTDVSPSYSMQWMADHLDLDSCSEMCIQFSVEASTTPFQDANCSLQRPVLCRGQ